MLRIEVKNGNIEKALSLYKRKTNKTKQNKILREKQEYTKPSVAKREMMQNAKYVEQKFRNQD